LNHTRFRLTTNWVSASVTAGNVRFAGRSLTTEYSEYTERGV